jgi:hypothetical protein
LRILGHHLTHLIDHLWCVEAGSAGTATWKPCLQLAIASQAGNHGSVESVELRKTMKPLETETPWFWAHRFFEAFHLNIFKRVKGSLYVTEAQRTFLCTT